MSVNILFYNIAYHTCFHSPLGQILAFQCCYFKYYTQASGCILLKTLRVTYKRGSRCGIWNGETYRHRHSQVTMSIIFKVDISVATTKWTNGQPRLSETSNWKNRVQWAKTAGQRTFLHRHIDCVTFQNRYMLVGLSNPHFSHHTAGVINESLC